MKKIDEINNILQSLTKANEHINFAAVQLFNLLNNCIKTCNDVRFRFGYISALSLETETDMIEDANEIRNLLGILHQITHVHEYLSLNKSILREFTKFVSCIEIYNNYLDKLVNVIDTDMMDKMNARLRSIDSALDNKVSSLPVTMNSVPQNVLDIIWHMANSISKLHQLKCRILDIESDCYWIFKEAECFAHCLESEKSLDNPNYIKMLLDDMTDAELAMRVLDLNRNFIETVLSTEIEPLIKEDPNLSIERIKHFDHVLRLSQARYLAENQCGHSEQLPSKRARVSVSSVDSTLFSTESKRSRDDTEYTMKKRF